MNFAIFEEIVHNFGRSDDDILVKKCLFSIFQWFDAQLNQKILDCIYFACTKLYAVAYMEFLVDQIIGKGSDAV